MNNKRIIDSIFYPRKSEIGKSDSDHIITVEEGVQIGCRFYLKDKSFDNIIFFHGNAELAQEYGDVADFYHDYACNLIVADYRGYGLSNGVSNRDNLFYLYPNSN